VAGWLSSAFGGRADPFNGSADFHPGLDISANRGTPVFATTDGTVQAAKYSGNYGNAVLIDHGFGIATRFAHLSGFVVRAGQQVRRGQVVGYVGSTGRATSSHLHYEILLNGRAVNPMPLLTARP
jgi:murein DD-endopeptidase MepM/ murein hydrolase activator NlpD